jgi:undecaprenyl pyrophosphate phosphatase UppP
MTLFCKGSTAAYRRYRKDVLRYVTVYVVVVLSAAWFVKHDGREHLFLYFWSVLPAIPILAIILRMAQYLSEEKDEFQKLVMMRAILVGTGALLAAIVVSDFLRSFGNAGAVPPFVYFTVFCVGMAVAQLVQWRRNRVSDDEQVA